MKPCISVVVPCYNEEEALPAVVQALQTQTDDLFTEEATLELILVNDGSSDRTLSVMKSLLHSIHGSYIFLFHETSEKKQLCWRDCPMLRVRM